MTDKSNKKKLTPIVSHIVAHTKNHVIGKDNKMPWHLPADLKFFKKTTMGKPIIMGRKTFESIGRPLPGRLNIIITRNKEFQAKGVEVTHSVLSALLLAARESDAEEIMIVGGANLYQQTLPYIDRVYQTRIDVEMEGDVFYPQLRNEEWEEISNEEYPADEKNKFNLQFLQYDRKS